jgi:hypothetical protein
MSPLRTQVKFTGWMFDKGIGFLEKVIKWLDLGKIGMDL